ncbi:hypothetical protein LTR10_018098 [Elasticomyces elasticus]|uniref:FAD-binding domain-containing protein n=1 Tax=Exophiala sideris TaxID=1016849 RepID=A0ABR0IW50_9EURO|nr:hypothetical protein LTR10_018098 [Elasticomyces elasticus]KAK5021695.1 hypothetical protein LTS07_010737 [Exophiala sideris]KAK5025150.1 hypothetical protein LTR13_010587 [Exophiala sideris]KAK5050126.1 hypothetical protein LTR69_010760 [Exophiala sideris]KAK5176874.1 hypothetical protein LTR44_010570 [Eurotiomycetes sp. CCFEE 6388]
MATGPPPPQTCAIIGAGPAGLAAALALRKLTSIQPTIYEARPSPSTMGGAINMGANALDLLRYLGINGAVIPGNRTNKMEIFSLRTGSKLGEMPFTAGPQGEPARRMLRADLQNVMLARAKQLDIPIQYSSRVASVHDSEAESEPDMQDPKSRGSPQVTITFTNSSTISADFVLGCDGIFSAVRRTYVQPDRHPIYTGSGSGVAAAYTVLRTSRFPSTLPTHSIVAGTSTRGWSLMSYCDAAQTQIFAAVVLPLPRALPETRKGQTQQDWQIYRAGEDKNHNKTNIVNEFRSRFTDAKVDCVRDLAAIEGLDQDLYVYPLLQLPREGRWCKGRVLLLGDAAHAMPPQGEGTSFALEDAVLLARIFATYPCHPIDTIFTTYEKTRRPRIELAWKETNNRSDDARPSSWIGQIFFGWIICLFLWFRGGSFGNRFFYDVRQEPITLI